MALVWIASKHSVMRQGRKERKERGGKRMVADFYGAMTLSLFLFWRSEDGTTSVTVCSYRLVQTNSTPQKTRAVRRRAAKRSGESGEEGNCYV